jgi:hypothetical protein
VACKLMARSPINIFVAAILLAATASALAKVEKFAIPGEKGMSFYWWPKLPPVAGWKQDREFSFRYRINALAPEGTSFGSAETVIYAKAVFKPRVPDVKTLGDLIENDKRDFLANVPGVIVREAPSITTVDGQQLNSLTYTPTGQGNWERVSYLDEGDFYLIFTLSSRTQAGFNASSKAYEDMVSQYK